MSDAALDLVGFLLARIAEDEDDARPRTVIRSGGWPAPDVLNCIGVKGKGCPDAWALPGKVDSEPNGPHWWDAAEVRGVVREHERTHVSPDQALALLECATKRSIVELCRPDYEDSLTSNDDTTGLGTEILTVLASVYALRESSNPRGG